MNYPLANFDRIVFGDLSPLRIDQSRKLNNISYLELNHPNATIISLYEFKNIKGKQMLQSKMDVCSLHPAANKIISNQFSLFEYQDPEHLCKDLQQHLELNEKEIRKIFQRKQANKTTIGLQKECNWHKIPETKLKFNFYCGLLQKEKEDLIQNIKNTIAGFSEKKEIENYIHQLQQSLISFRLKVVKSAELKQDFGECLIKKEYNNDDVFALIYFYIEKILCFLERNYVAYIDQNCTIPFHSKIIKDNDLENRGKLILDTILSSTLNRPLKLLVLDPIFKLSHLNAERPITYQELIYCKMYLSELFVNIPISGPVQEDRLEKTLFKVNYNSPDFFNYLIKNLKSKLNDLNHAHLKLDFLLKTLKEINQKHSWSHVALYPNEPPLKTQLSNWIEEEIQYCKKSKKIKVPDPTLFTVPTNLPAHKFQTNFSVSEMAFFIRIFNDAGLFCHENQTEFLQFMADNFSSKQKEKISSTSLRSKYYSPENSAIFAIQEQLEKMLLIIKNY